MNTSEDNYVQAVYLHGISLMKAGMTDNQVIHGLMDEGLDQDSAGIVVTNLASERSRQQRKGYIKSMFFGAIWFVGGSAITLATYSAASSGGRYVVTWGAILFGGYQLLSGLIGYLSSGTIRRQ